MKRPKLFRAGTALYFGPLDFKIGYTAGFLPPSLLESRFNPTHKCIKRQFNDMCNIRYRRGCLLFNAVIRLTPHLGYPVELCVWVIAKTSNSSKRNRHKMYYKNKGILWQCKPETSGQTSCQQYVQRTVASVKTPLPQLEVPAILYKTIHLDRGGMILRHTLSPDF